MNQQNEIQWIPLRKLTRSDHNMRTTPATADAMRELEASIDAVGLLENLVVRADRTGKTTAYRVVGGARRLGALQSLAKRRNSTIRPATPIPCRVIPDDAIDEEISLIENIVRVDMHPVDQFTAFAKLIERGLTVAAIANRFGLTARTVQRRLRLGGVASQILTDARGDRVTLDQLEAFASTPDRTRQVKVWNKMRNQAAYAPSNSSWIRNELQRGLLSAASPRVRFVGLDDYKNAGGAVEEDLFASQDDRSVHVRDVALLDKLASGKLEAAKADLGTGWRWIEAVLETAWDVIRQYGRLKGTPEPPSDGDHAKLAALTARIDDLKTRLHKLDGETDDRERLTAQIADAEAAGEALDSEMHSRESYGDEQRACSGCLLTIGDEGQLVVHRGLVRREDEHLVPKPRPVAAPAEAAPDEAEGGSGDVPAPEAPTSGTDNGSDEPPALRDDTAASPPEAAREHPGVTAPPERPPKYTPPAYEPTESNPSAAATREAGLRLALADDLRLIRNGIVQARLADDFNLAFDLAAYQLARAIFGEQGDGPLAITIAPTANAPAGVDANDNEALARESPGARILTAEAATLKLEWLDEPDGLRRFRAFRKLPPRDRHGLFAAAVARALRPQLALDPDRRAETEAAIEALDIPFHTLHRPDLERFWRRMGRREMLQVAAETLGEAWKDRHACDGKDKLAGAMAGAFGTGRPPDELQVTPDARDRALAWAPPGFRAAPEPMPAAGDRAPGVPADVARTADSIPAWMRE